MSDDQYYYEPAQGHGLPHDPFNAIIGPRPIGWISSQDAEGRLNLAPYSFFNAFNYTPPIIGFASVGRKDSLNNIERTGEFAWNLVTRPLAEAMNQSCAAVWWPYTLPRRCSKTVFTILRQLNLCCAAAARRTIFNLALSRYFACGALQ